MTFFTEPLAVMDGVISRAGVPSEVGEWFISGINSGELKSWLTPSIGYIFFFFLHHSRTSTVSPLSSDLLQNVHHTIQPGHSASAQMRLSWKNNPVPGTRLAAHVPGPRFFFLNLTISNPANK